MFTYYVPDTVAPPASNYSHAVEVPANARWLYISGQVGMRRDGTMAEGFEAQAEQAWENLLAVLDAAGMGPSDLVRVNTYVIDRDMIGPLRKLRLRYMGGVEPASTLVVVSSLAVPEWLVEIEAVAAKVES